MPSEFKVDVTPDINIPIPSEQIYRLAIHMIYDVTATPLPYAWHSRGWASGLGDSGIQIIETDFGPKQPSHLTTQDLIWGLNHLMLSIYLSGRYCQTTASLKLRGVEVGVIHVAKITALDARKQRFTNRGDPLNTTMHGNPIVDNDDDEDVEVSVNYRETTSLIAPELIYLTAIKALGEAAELGLDVPAQRLLTQSLQRTWWKLLSGAQVFTGILRPRHSRIAVVKTLAVMIEERRFQGILVWVKVNGDNTAAGGFGQGEVAVSG